VSPLDTKEIIPTQHTKKARRDTSTLPLQLMPCSHASSLTARFPCRTHPHSSRTGFLILQRHRHGHVRARRKLPPPEASVLRAISIRAYGMHATAASGVKSARTGRGGLWIACRNPFPNPARVGRYSRRNSPPASSPASGASLADLSGSTLCFSQLDL
jgi:hypothetical protein